MLFALEVYIIMDFIINKYLQEQPEFKTSMNRKNISLCCQKNSLYIKIGVSESLTYPETFDR